MVGNSTVKDEGNCIICTSKYSNQAFLSELAFISFKFTLIGKIYIYIEREWERERERERGFHLMI